MRWVAALVAALLASNRKAVDASHDAYDAVLRQL